jgi:cardiolipin synthase
MRLTSLRQVAEVAKIDTERVAPQDPAPAKTSTVGLAPTVLKQEKGGVPSVGAAVGFSQKVSPQVASMLGASAGAQSLTGSTDSLAVAVADRLFHDLKFLSGRKGEVKNILAQVAPEQMNEVELEFFARRKEPLRKALADSLVGASQRDALTVYDSKACATELGGTSPKKKISQLLAKGYVEEAELKTSYGFRSNDIELMVQGKNAFPKVFEAIDKAEHHVHVCYYIFANDELGRQFKDKLIAAKRRGVEVRLSMDGVGSSLLIPGSPSRKLIKELEAEGIIVQRNHIVDLQRSNQMLNHPDHRKIVIVDGKVGFTGGMNVADHYVEQYHDLMIKVEGEGVHQMQAEFLAHWLHLGSSFHADPDELDEYFPKVEAGKMRSKVSQAIPGEHMEIFQTYIDRINSAEKCIYIENPYCTNPDVQTALIEAGKRGVEIHVVLPGENDHAFSHWAARQRYPEMIRAGVNIYEYPGFNHGKVMMVDDKFVTFGSSNLDDVALYHIYEMNMDIEDPGFAATVKKDIFDVDLLKSRKMKAEDVTRWQKVSGSFFRLFAHWI